MQSLKWSSSKGKLKMVNFKIYRISNSRLLAMQ